MTPTQIINGVGAVIAHQTLGLPNLYRVGSKEYFNATGASLTPNAAVLHAACHKNLQLGGVEVIDGAQRYTNVHCYRHGNINAPERYRDSVANGNLLPHPYAKGLQHLGTIVAISTGVPAARIGVATKIDAPNLQTAIVDYSAPSDASPSVSYVKTIVIVGTKARVSYSSANHHALRVSGGRSDASAHLRVDSKPVHPTSLRAVRVPAGQGHPLTPVQIIDVVGKIVAASQALPPSEFLARNTTGGVNVTELTATAHGVAGSGVCDPKQPTYGASSFQAGPVELTEIKCYRYGHPTQRGRFKYHQYNGNKFDFAAALKRLGTRVSASVGIAPAKTGSAITVRATLTSAMLQFAQIAGSRSVRDITINVVGSPGKTQALRVTRTYY